MLTPTEENVVQLALCFPSCYVVGGALRDAVVRNEPCRDLDVIFTNREHKGIFIRLLETQYEVRTCLPSSYSHIAKTTLILQDNVTIDIAEGFHKDIDFVCNCLSQSVDHGIQYHLLPETTKRNKYINKYIMENCVSNIRNKKLVIVPNTSMYTREMYAGICKCIINRTLRMMRKGWELVSPMHPLLKTFALTSLARSRSSDTVCAICQEAFETESDELLLRTKCNHLFHIDCFESGGVACPVCKKGKCIL